MIACRATGCLLGLWREQAVGRYARRCADGLSPRIDRDSCRLDGVGRRTCARRSAVAMMLDRGPGERVVKYIASVLLLLFSALVRLPVSSASSSSTYRVEAWFQEIDTTGVSTDLSIVVEQHATATNVRLAVDRTSPACDRDPHDCPADMISAYTNTLVGAGDFVAAPTCSGPRCTRRLTSRTAGRGSGPPSGSISTGPRPAIAPPWMVRPRWNSSTNRCEAPWRVH